MSPAACVQFNYLGQADGGGSDNTRLHLRKTELQTLADQTGLSITVTSRRGGPNSPMPARRKHPRHGHQDLDAEMATINIKTADFHGECNSTIKPREPDNSPG